MAPMFTACGEGKPARGTLTPMVDEIEDPRRVDPPFVNDERSMLEAWLEWHRTTLLIKCEDLDDAGLRAQPIATSLMSLHGLVRHMAEVERNWFPPRARRRGPSRRHLLDRRETRRRLRDRRRRDVRRRPRHLAGQIDIARRNAAGKDLDFTGIRRGEPCSLRWIYVHMIEEYARHNGHADLIRELVDGAVGA
jgi:hypothetical protein